MTLTGSSNTYSGATDIIDATLLLGANGGFSPNSVINVGATAILNFNSFTAPIAGVSGTGTIIMSGGGTLTVGTGNASSTFSGNLGGNGGVTKVGTGVFTIDSVANTYSEPTVVQAGTVQAGMDNSFSPNSPVVLSTGILNVNGYNNTIGGLSGTAGSVVELDGTLGVGAALTINGGNSPTGYAGAITGTLPGNAIIL